MRVWAGFILSMMGYVIGTLGFAYIFNQPPSPFEYAYVFGVVGALSGLALEIKEHVDRIVLTLENQVITDDDEDEVVSTTSVPQTSAS